MSKLVDLTGQRFGMLTVIGFDHVDKDNGAMWSVVCDCGVMTIKRGRSMKAGNTLSCGNHKWNKLHEGVAAKNGLYRVYKSGAKRRGLAWELTLEQFSEITQRNCVYCNLPPLQETKFTSGYNGVYKYNGIDRVKNEIGYTLENSVPCCGICNMMKGTMSSADFIKQILLIHSNWFS